jgi:putative membrane protein
MNRISRARSAFAVGALVALAAGTAFCAGPATTTTQMSDSTFAKKADEGNLAEVKLARLAESKAQSPAVKKFARRIIADHTQANDKLKDAASQANINLPSQPDAKQKETYDRLSQLSGAAFDRAYARDQITDHRHDISVYKNEAQNGQNPQIKQYAESTLPVLHEHLTLARQMNRAVENGGANGSVQGGASVNGVHGTYNGGAGATGGANGGANGTGGANGGANGTNGGVTTPR